ncbi:RelA/SpoT family protein [Sphingomonas nostoxanthinifaciens]|uniref:RelA/SpoT family protein n=1 Tax=Sphingomonas nostoxanthinifaciens TaxID=2872652 RepID=UPI001CC1CDC7|nr:bifunctional (p)ppGpp synthetase/guanosine-3',5'-bis(diphosphate) 3'-pyrophosphohydrolase [Sphingomonas nostoxanthinifaciens]UAK24622.1 bifunctional (p)ppGpp synthetase/guanosine-3',5'-bis(diphosphate) 3'-pyrophosphohydrolase [Sphingomonas nostoxanthinifaciens]
MLRQYELVDRVLSYDPTADEALLNRAYVFSMAAHGSQKRANGDPYFSHPIEVAGILTDLNLDDETIATAILHDTIEDTLATPEQVEKSFGPAVARLVDGVTKLSKIEAQSESQRAAENLRKFLLAMSDDIRVLLVKLADRLHNMRTLKYIPAEAKRRRIARETMDIYAPLAERIGMYEFMTEMQTLAFRELEPEAYDSIVRRLDQLKEGGGDRVARISSGIRLLLGQKGIKAEVEGREKHPYSIWRKMTERHISFEQLSDVMAFRVVLEDDEQCYRALGLLHGRWPMVPGRFKDYISTPKRNGYRSLHTAVIHSERVRIEIQIRTAKMHAEAEYGVAAHWAYKQGGTIQPDVKSRWIRDLVEILDHASSAEELLEHTRMAMYQDRIFAFTPKGELIQLPKGATPVDFAYAVHTDLGDQTVGAKINGRVVPLRTPIKNGDQVQILRSAAQEPQAAWMSFAATGKARASIRRFVRQKEQAEMVALGRRFYDAIVARLPAQLGPNALDEAIRRLKVTDADRLMEQIARGILTDEQVMEALMPGSAKQVGAAPRAARAVSMKGLTPGVAFTLAQCCTPVPGDRIVGVRLTDRPVEVHVIECPVLQAAPEEDWVDLAWGDGSEGGTARLNVIVRNEPGSLGVMAGILGAQGANIVNLTLSQRDQSFHTFHVVIEVHDVAHLMRILAGLRAADAIASAERMEPQPPLLAA